MLMNWNLSYLSNDIIYGWHAQMHHVTRNEALNAAVALLGDVQPASFIPSSYFNSILILICRETTLLFVITKGMESSSRYSLSTLGVEAGAWVFPQQQPGGS